MEYPNGWENEGSFLARTFAFGNFIEAVAFVDRLVPLAEKAKHHPDVEIFGYRKVKVKLTTHEAGYKVTEKDVELAEKINRLLPQKC